MVRKSNLEIRRCVTDLSFKLTEKKKNLDHYSVY